MDVPGLVETSLNLGVAELDDSEAILRFSLRSSVPSARLRSRSAAVYTGAIFSG